MFRRRDTKIHFVGIGGMGMCGIAEVLINLGYPVSGSDMNKTEITEHLENIGGTIHYCHESENVGQADVVVVSSAIKGYNPEIEAARALGVPVIPRAEMLGELMRMKCALAVAGSHGKTTTTTMIAWVLMQAGLDPTAVIGGRVKSFGLANARLGKSDYLVAEADESDGSFLTLFPTLAVVTNIDAEHLDHYGTHENVKKAFVDFINRIPFYGQAFLCLDHPHVQQILPEVHKRYVTYGESPQADWRARDIRFDGFRTSYVAWKGAEELGRVTLAMPGVHNVLNSLVALAMADFLDVPFATSRDALASFQGIERRFTVRGEKGGVLVVDDFGHHPTEVRATLSGARKGFMDRRVVAAFQPHRHSRTRDQFEEFARSFNDCDAVVVCDIFGAGETPIEGITSEALVKAIREHGHKDVTYVAKREDVAAHLAKHTQPGDIVVTMGAGDIQLTCIELLDLLPGESTAQAGEA